MSKSKRTNRKQIVKSEASGKRRRHNGLTEQCKSKGMLLRILVLVVLAVVGSFVWRGYLGTEFVPNRSETDDAVASNSDLSIENLSDDQLETRLKLPPALAFQKEASENDTNRLAELIEDEIQSLRRTYPNDAHAEHLHGLFLLRLKRTKLAEPSLRRCVELAPNNQQMRIDLADLLGQLGRDYEALRVLEDYPASSPLTIDFLWKLGDFQLRFGEIEASEKTLLSAVQLAPMQPAMRAQLGKIQLQQNKVDEAKENAKKAIELEPTEPENWLLLNRIATMQKQTEEAHHALTRWRSLKEKADLVQPKKPFEIQHPESMAKVFGSAFRSLAILHQAKGNLPTANAMFERALEADPQNAVTLADWAGLQRQVGNYDKAAELNRRLLRLKPLEVVHYQNLANISMELNLPLDAEAALRLACLRIPTNGNCQLLLARFLLLAEKPEEAVAPARRAVQMLRNSEAETVLKQSQNAIQAQYRSHSHRN